MRLVLSLFFALILSCPVQAQTTQIVFRVDMRQAAARGWFEPDTETVGVRGSAGPLSWANTVVAADPDGDLVYELKLVLAYSKEPLKYKFKVDGSDNPNDGWETRRDRTVELDGGFVEEAHLFDEPEVDSGPTFTGNVEVITDVSSEFLAPSRDIYVYTPPGYGGSGQRYPVLYLHDGAGAFDSRAVGIEWGVDEAAQGLIEAGEIEPLIIVGIANTGDRIAEYTPTVRRWRHELARTGAGEGWLGTYSVREDASIMLTIKQVDGRLRARLPESENWNDVVGTHSDTLHVVGPSITLSASEREAGTVTRVTASRPDAGGAGPAYGRFLFEELKPLIDEVYRTLPGRTSVGGSSLGGLISLYLGTVYPVEGLLVVSPSVWWDDASILEKVSRADLGGTRIWIDVGTGEGPGMVQGARALRDIVSSKVAQGDWAYVEEADARHNESAWAARFPDMLRFLYGR